MLVPASICRMHICMNHILKCEKHRSLYILWNQWADIPFFISNYNQLGLYKLDSPSSALVNDNTEMEFSSSVSIHGIYICPQLLYITNLQYTNKIRNPTQMEMSH